MAIVLFLCCGVGDLLQYLQGLIPLSPCDPHLLDCDFSAECSEDMIEANLQVRIWKLLTKQSALLEVLVTQDNLGFLPSWVVLLEELDSRLHRNFEFRQKR